MKRKEKKLQENKQQTHKTVPNSIEENTIYRKVLKNQLFR